MAVSRFASIYSERKRLASLRQVTYSKHLGNLDAALLTECGMDNPYERFCHSLLRVPTYLGGSIGTQVKSKKICFYRFSTFGKIFNAMGWKNTKFRSFTDVMKYYLAQNEEWLPLNLIFTGIIPTKRSFTFWTTSQKLAEARISDLYRIGLVNDWLGSGESLILRIDARNVITHSRIPTIIDGYNEPIFEPTDSASYRRIGTAIDITDISDIKPGLRELVINDVHSSFVMFKPRILKLSEANKDITLRSSSFMDQLVNYYKSL